VPTPQIRSTILALYKLVCMYVPSGTFIYPAVWLQTTIDVDGKLGTVPLLGELDPHLTQRRLG